MDWVRELVDVLADTVFDVLPILLVLVFFQIVVLRRRLADPKRILIGFVYVLLGLTAGSALLLPPRLVAPSSAVAQSPDEIDLLGVVRDFHSSHPDFDISAGSWGHQVGNVDVINRRRVSRYAAASCQIT